MAVRRDAERRFGTVAERGGRFLARWRIGGRQSGRTFATRAEAGCFLARVEACIEEEVCRAAAAAPADADAAGRREIRPASMTLERFQEQALATWRMTLRPRSMSSRPAVLRRAAEFFGAKVMAEVTRADCEAFIRRRTADGAAGVTVRFSERAILSGAWRLAIRAGCATANPWRDRDLVLPRAEGVTVPRMSAAEVEALYAAVPPRTLIAVVLAGECGLRRHEVVTLRRSDVLPDFSGVTVRADLAKSHRMRTVPTTARAAKALRVQLARLTGRQDSRVYGWSDETLNHDVRAAADRLGMPDVHPHTLRHAYAIALLDACVPLTVIRDLLGHCSLQVTERYLGQSTAGATRAAAVALERARRGARPRRRPSGRRRRPVRPDRESTPAASGRGDRRGLSVPRTLLTGRVTPRVVAHVAVPTPVRAGRPSATGRRAATSATPAVRRGPPRRRAPKGTPSTARSWQHHRRTTS